MRGTLEPRSWDPEKKLLLRAGAFLQGGNQGVVGSPLPALSPWIQIINDVACSPGSLRKQPLPGELLLLSKASKVTTELRMSSARSMRPPAGKTGVALPSGVSYNGEHPSGGWNAPSHGLLLREASVMHRASPGQPCLTPSRPAPYDYACHCRTARGPELQGGSPHTWVRHRDAARCLLSEDRAK